MKLFNAAQSDAPQVSTFDLSHEHKLSLNMGDLVPILCRETLPGDIWNINTEVFLRMMPTLAPIMHRVDVHLEAFFVPNYIVWNNFQKFITGGDHGEDNPVHPTLNYAALDYENTLYKAKKGSLADYMGLPVLQDGQINNTNFQFNALPFKAYQSIWNEFYRDQNLQEPIDIKKENDGDDQPNEELLTLRKRCWEKDYFTSCLPTPQKGETVLLPLQGSVTSDATVEFSPKNISSYTEAPKFKKVDGSNLSDGGDVTAYTVGDGSHTVGIAGYDTAAYDPNGTLKASVTTDLNEISGQTTINDLREAFQLQRYLEKLMRGGSRYVEFLRTFWGVNSSDKSLQLPQLIGAKKIPMVISEVAQTSATQDDSPQGNLVGKGLSIGRNDTISYRCENEGFIFVLMSIMPKTAYQQGVERQFTRTTRLDYANPTFAHLGEQEVLSKELFMDFNDDDTSELNTRTFGYQSRYAEYKYIPCRVSGDLRDNLDYWHMGRKLASSADAVLNSQFVTADPTTRIFPVVSPNQRPIYGQVYHKITCTRKLPYIGDPGMIDHF